ncbi:MAG TPA: hypothetical protein VLF66_13715, partial [Thermoanaerobaculia bacterium]|nr:hypothetical protein [Thermoanaerobaculia bacterium]
MDDRNQAETSTTLTLATYQAVNQHWAHAEQERWAILYNFLMASTILLLAWAAVFASEPSLLRRIVLAVLALAGATISLLWVTIGCRVSSFIRVYGELGEQVERQLGIGSVGPFHAGERLRIEEKRNPTDGTMMDRWGRKVASRQFMVILPLLFATIYVLLLVASLVR